MTGLPHLLVLRAQAATLLLNQIRRGEDLLGTGFIEDLTLKDAISNLRLGRLRTLGVPGKEPSFSAIAFLKKLLALLRQVSLDVHRYAAIAEDQMTNEIAENNTSNPLGHQKPLTLQDEIYHFMWDSICRNNSASPSWMDVGTVS